jgi:hypothetical protein
LRIDTVHQGDQDGFDAKMFAFWLTRRQIGV